MAATGGRSSTNLISSEKLISSDELLSSDGGPPGPHETQQKLTATEPIGTHHSSLPPRGTGRPPPSARVGTSASSHDRLRSTPPSDPSDLGSIRDSLLAARRYGATLNGLLSALDVFTRGVESARLANDSLQRRIERLKDALDGSEARTRELEKQVAELEARLLAQEVAYVAERQFLTDEQDQFLQALLEEHEAELQSVRQQDEREAPPSSRDMRAAAPPAANGDVETVQELRDKIEVLQAERERARELVQRLRTQRDGAQAELKRVSQTPTAANEASTIAPAGGAHPTTPAPPPFASSRTPASSSADEHEAAILQNLGVVRLPRLSPPPAELAGALHIPARPGPPAARREEGGGPARPPTALSSTVIHSAIKKTPSQSSLPATREPEEDNEAGQAPPPGTRPGIGARSRALPKAPAPKKD